jgi:hypothetical protein
MKLKNFIYLISISFTLSACETLPDPEVEHSSIWPLSGEWLTHVYNDQGVAIGATASNSLGSLVALRTYNTADNSSTLAWMRLGSTQAYAMLGKVNCDINQKTFSGTNVPFSGQAGRSFTIQEGKVLLNATTLLGYSEIDDEGKTVVHPGSGITTDSIYVRYTSSADGKTYVAKGHRRSHWAEDEY